LEDCVSDLQEKLVEALPSAPEVNEVLLAYQKSFVLMHLFCDEDRSMTRSELHKKLSSASSRDALLYGRWSSDVQVNADPSTMDGIVLLLADSKDVTVRKHGKGARYTLTDRGQESLMATDQHPSLEFRLNGKQLNALLEAIRASRPGTAPRLETREEPLPSVAAINAAPQPTLTTQAVIDAFEELRRERFARNGIVPVHELRRLLVARHGPEAGSHATLDPILKQMRREKQLRLIAIGDLSEATTEQLDDSVPGENETFFYLEAAHEYAGVR
jgi:hypothetical protein